VTDASPRIVFVAGLSGSGKSTAMAALEDQSFYCVDNLPPQLIEQFLALCANALPPIERIALAIDSREARFLRELPEVVRSLRKSHPRVDVLFLEASNPVLVNRYRETRRVHPLAPGGGVEQGIEAERRVLAPLSLRELIFHLLRSEHAATLRWAARGPDRARIQEAMTFLREHHEQKLTVEAVARRVAMSPSHFAHRFREVARMSPMRYLKTVRLQAARELLLVRGVGAAEAAGKVGYQSVSHFTRDFGRHFGEPPARYATRFRRAV